MDMCFVGPSFQELTLYHVWGFNLNHLPPLGLRNSVDMYVFDSLFELG